MPKILYPVGTQVQIRDWKLADLRTEGHTYDHRARTVSEYDRGSDTPYSLEGVDYNFKVDEIKTYRVTAGKNDYGKFANLEVKSNPVETAKTPQNTLSASDVREIIRAELSEAKVEMTIKMDEEMRKQIQETVLNTYHEAQVASAEAELCDQLNNTIASLEAEEDNNMSEDRTTIRQKLIYAAKPKAERVLSENDILSNGYLTEQGRRVVLDVIWANDKDLQTEVFKAVEKLNKKAKKGKKDSDEDDE